MCCLLIDHLDAEELAAMFTSASRVLKNGGWLYVTDVNPYFEVFRESYAKFWDDAGRQVRIRVFPHGLSEVRELTHECHLKFRKFHEEKVSALDVKANGSLSQMVGLPLIFEYYFVRANR